MVLIEMIIIMTWKAHIVVIAKIHIHMIRTQRTFTHWIIHSLLHLLQYYGFQITIVWTPTTRIVSVVLLVVVVVVVITAAMESSLVSFTADLVSVVIMICRHERWKCEPLLYAGSYRMLLCTMQKRIKQNCLHKQHQE